MRNPSALLRTTIRLAVRVVQSARRRQETCACAWLPEPTDHQAGPDMVAERQDAVERDVFRAHERLAGSTVAPARGPGRTSTAPERLPHGGPVGRPHAPGEGARHRRRSGPRRHRCCVGRASADAPLRSREEGRPRPQPPEPLWTLFCSPAVRRSGRTGTVRSGCGVGAANSGIGARCSSRASRNGRSGGCSPPADAGSYAHARGRLLDHREPTVVVGHRPPVVARPKDARCSSNVRRHWTYSPRGSRPPPDMALPTLPGSVTGTTSRRRP